jgi:phage/plasmid primase-like uncharacterized protein
MTTVITDALAAQLSLHRAGREWRGACPLCGYRHAFVLNTGRNGAPVAWCASCQDRDGIRALLRDCGAIPSAANMSAETQRREEQRQKSKERALALWRGSGPAAGTIAARYFAARGLSGLAHLPALRFRADCWHEETRGKYPALMALVTDVNDQPIAIHRTYVRRDGSGKADIEPNRKSLGPIWGGAIRLDPLAPGLVIGEGIETSASAGRLLGLPAWAAVSAGNLARGVVLPPGVGLVVIAADPDPAGRDAAHAAWFRWRAEGRQVQIATPDHDNCDFNDLLLQRCTA